MTKESFEGIPKAILDTADAALGPADRVRSTGPERAPEYLARQRFARPGVAHPTPDPHCSRTPRI